MLVRLAGLTKSFRQTVAVHPLDLEIAAGDFLAILGPSGCARPRCRMGGFETPTTGRVEIAGKDVTNMRRRSGRQHGLSGLQLFPHINVRQRHAAA
jgi:ABC-type Fe3+/spermidine/putrescine transport system ATPase subunit